LIGFLRYFRAISWTQEGVVAEKSSIYRGGREEGGRERGREGGRGRNETGLAFLDLTFLDKGRERGRKGGREGGREGIYIPVPGSHRSKRRFSQCPQRTPS